MSVSPPTFSTEFPFTQVRPPVTLKTLGFALLIIIGIGSLAVGVAGVCGYYGVGSLSHLGQINSIIMMSVGSGAGFLLMIAGVITLVKNRKSYPVYNLSGIQSCEQLRPYMNKMVSLTLSSYPGGKNSRFQGRDRPPTKMTGPLWYFEKPNSSSLYTIRIGFFDIFHINDDEIKQLNRN